MESSTPILLPSIIRVLDTFPILLPNIVTLLPSFNPCALSNITEKNDTQVKHPQDATLNNSDGKNIIYPQLIRRKVKPVYYTNVSSANSRQALPI